MPIALEIVAGIAIESEPQHLQEPQRSLFGNPRANPGASFAMILAGSELFTNGVEWAGQRLGIAEAAVGSLLAAVGTALPETFIPAVALLTGRESPARTHAVGLGAIVGAPLMLSTVALFVMGVAAIAFRKRRGQIALQVVTRRRAPRP